jgi:predicted TPR repeat methyltransferase
MWSTRTDTWAAYLHDRWRGDPDGVHTVLDLCCGTGLMSAALRDSAIR